MGWGFSLSRLNLSCFNSYPLLIILLPRTTVKNLYGRLLLAFKSWKQGQVTSEGHRNPVKMCRVGVREAKPSVAERGKVCGRQQAFHRYTGRKRKITENVDLLNGAGVLMTKDMEKAEVFHVFLALVTTGKTFGNCRPLRPLGKARPRTINPWLKRIELNA